MYKSHITMDAINQMRKEVKADIEIAIRQADKGDVLPHDEVKKKYPQWFTK